MTPGRVLIYSILLAGSVVFSFPFVWMASTSMKVDRELFTQSIRIIPEQPIPRTRSPYYENRRFHHIDTRNPQAQTLLPWLRRRIDDSAARLPRAAIDGNLPDTLAPGLFDLLARRTPVDIWDASDPSALLNFARDYITDERLRDIAAQAYRELGIRAPRARSHQLLEADLLPELPPHQQWELLTPHVASVHEAAENLVSYAAVHYDFTRGNRMTLRQTFDLPFPSAELQRFQLRIRPDDTWHALTLSLESGGVRHVAERPLHLADFQWQTVTWQFPSPDDDSTKLKTWIVLHQAGRAPEFDHGPNRVRVTLDIEQVTPLRAGFAKARYNYIRVLDQIPFWRYVRVSVVLVILNIVLTLLSSSLVAYAFARLQWPGRDVLFLVMLGTMMIPGQVTMIPHFLIWKTLGAYNTLTPLWAGAALGNAFFIFMMRQFLKGVPTDLEDAARIDGCGTLRIWWHVMLPMVKPCLAAIAIFTFIGAWNDFLGPLLYIADQRLYPLAFGLYAFNVQIENRPVLIMACALMMTLPVIAVFFAAQRYFIQGITLTGMKG